jgi:competence protein ComEC
MLFLIAFISGALFFFLLQFFPFSILLFFFCTSAFLIWKRSILLVFVLLLGILYPFLRYSPEHDISHLQGKRLKATGSFIPATQAPGSDLLFFNIDRLTNSESGEELDGTDDLEIGLRADPDVEIDYDELYDLVLETDRDRSRLNPGQQRKARLFGRVISADISGKEATSLFNFVQKKRSSLDQYLSGRFTGDPAGLISAITTGNKAFLSDELRGAFNAAGLAHILSISGTHFGLFSVMLFGTFAVLLRKIPYSFLQRLTLYVSPRQTAALMTLPFMILYLGISGGSIPAVRSFIMISLFLSGLLIDRKGFWLNSLLFAAFILVLADPGVLLSLSFQLSFTAVLFIGFSLERGKNDEEDEEPDTGKNRVVEYLRKAVYISAAAALGTSPLAAYYFHYVSLISPLSNLLIVPVIGFILIPLSLISSFTYIFTGHFVFAPLVSFFSELSIFMVKSFASIPFAEFRVPAFPPALCIAFYAGCLLYLVTGRSKKMLILSLLPFCIYSVLLFSGKKDLSITFIDVGQGDSSVIELPDGKTVVVDTGRTGKETAALLRYLGKRKIDSLVLTHSHPDHAGGVEYLSGKFRIDEIWDNGRIVYPDEMQINAMLRSLERGDFVGTPEYSITVLHPYKEFYSFAEGQHSEENNSSLVIKVTGKTASFLMTGDIEQEAETDIVHLKEWLRSDVIKVPHHGSKTSLSEIFLEGVSPSIAVISAGRNNAFGHPSGEILERLGNVQILRTDLDGAVKITERGNKLAVKTCRESGLEKADNFRTEKNNIVKLFSRW